MGDQWGAIRTTEGELVVGDDALRIRRPPREYLRGQAARRRGRGLVEWAGGTVKTVLFLSLPVFLAFRLHRIADQSPGLLASYWLFLTLLVVGQLWLRHGRGTRIPLSAVADVTLDPDDRELTLTHDPNAVDDEDSRWYFLAEDLGWSVLTPEAVETDVGLRTDDDVREARAALRTAGVVEGVEPGERDEIETETERRFETRKGAVFCPDCRGQVSPSDRTCPACGYALRVERPVDSGGLDRDDPVRDESTSREPAVEF